VTALSDLFPSLLLCFLLEYVVGQKRDTFVSAVRMNGLDLHCPAFSVATVSWLMHVGTIKEGVFSHLVLYKKVQSGNDGIKYKAVEDEGQKYRKKNFKARIHLVYITDRRSSLW